MPSAYSVAELEPVSHRDELLTLWSRNLPSASPARFDWMYAKGDARTWFASDGACVPIGAAGLMKRTFRVGDRLLPAGQAIDMNVDREHRSVGAALSLQCSVTETVLQDRLSLIYGTPNKQARAVMRRVGYVAIGNVRCWTKPLRSRYLLGRYLKWPVAARLAAPLVDVALKYRSPDAYYHRSATVVTEVSKQFDGRFDRLWERAAGQFPIIGERSAAYLNWRFRDCPELDYETLCLLNRKSGELMGYVVFCVCDGHLGIADLLFADERACGVLLSEFVRVARQQRCCAIHMAFFGSSLLTGCLRRAGFVERPRDVTVMAHLGDDDASNPSPVDLKDQENWFLTEADSDSDL